MQKREEVKKATTIQLLRSKMQHKECILQVSKIKSKVKSNTILSQILNHFGVLALVRANLQYLTLIDWVVKEPLIKTFYLRFQEWFFVKHQTLKVLPINEKALKVSIYFQLNPLLIVTNNNVFSLYKFYNILLFLFLLFLATIYPFGKLLPIV